MKVWLEYGMEAPCIFAAEEWKKYAVKVFSDVTEIECKRARKAGNVNAQDLEAGSAAIGSCSPGQRESIWSPVG